MNSKFLILLVAMFCVAGLMVFQATKSSSASVLEASDLINLGGQSSLSRIRVGGRVVDLPIEYTTEPNIQLSFRIANPGVNDLPTESNTVPVVYEGLKPDMFAPGRDVIIDGRFENGILYASNLLTQCPSKYEPPDGTTTSSGMGY
jgi:cytochrome c-type biogenesis protein CcmE